MKKLLKYQLKEEFSRRLDIKEVKRPLGIKHTDSSAVEKAIT